MKNTVHSRVAKFFQYSALLATVATLSADSCKTACKTTSASSQGGLFPHASFLPRSQSTNAARDIVGMQKHINQCDTECWAQTFAITGEGTRTFRHRKFAEFLVGSDRVVVSGSQSALKRGKEDILADYFGLPLDYHAELFFRPRMVNLLLDFNWSMDLPCNFYVRAHAPLVYSSADMRLTSQVQTSGGLDMPAGYLSAAAIPRAGLTPTVEDAFTGKYAIGDIEGLKYGKIDGRQTTVRLADVNLIAGYNYWCTDCYHLGANLRVVAPTGNRVTGEYLFTPIVGNGHFWEVGAGLSGSALLWECEDSKHSVSVYSDLNVTHFLSSKRNHSFDLVNNGSGSRYMLLAEFGANATDNPNQLSLVPDDGAPDVDVTVATLQYAGKLVPAINKTTLCSRVSIAVQADWMVKFAYTCGAFEFDLGYNLWARTRAKANRCQAFEANKYAVKGDAQMYGYFDPNNVTPVRLSATQSKATLNAGQGVGNFVTIPQRENANADAPVLFARACSTSVVTGCQVLSPDPDTVAVDAVLTSVTPVLLKDTDIVQEAIIAPKAISHKVFAHVSYTGSETCGVVPYIGMGGEVEIGTQSCNNSAASQWGIWTKFGLTY